MKRLGLGDDIREGEENVMWKVIFLLCGYDTCVVSEYCYVRTINAKYYYYLDFLAGRRSNNSTGDNQ